MVLAAVVVVAVAVAVVVPAVVAAVGGDGVVVVAVVVSVVSVPSVARTVAARRAAVAADNFAAAGPIESRAVRRSDAKDRTSPRSTVATVYRRSVDRSATGSSGNVATHGTERTVETAGARIAAGKVCPRRSSRSPVRLVPRRISVCA